MKSHRITKMDVQGYSSGPSGQTFAHIPSYPVLNSSSSFPRGVGLRHQSTKCQVGYLSDWRKGPRVSCFRDLVRKHIHDIFMQGTNYVLGDLVSDSGADLASDSVAILENQLFMEATSEEEYVNLETLYDRLQSLLQRKRYDANSSEQAGLPLCMPMLASGLHHGYCDSGAAETHFNCLTGASGSDSSGNNVFSANNADHVNLIKGYPFNVYKQGDSNRSIASNQLDMSFSSGIRHVASEIFGPLEGASASMTSHSDANQLSVTGGFHDTILSYQGNLNYSSDISFDCHVQQQHLDHDRLWSTQNAQSMVSPPSVGEFSVFPSSNLLIPQHISMEVPEVSDILSGTIGINEISTLEDIVQSCSQMIKSQHNRKRPNASDGPSSENIEEMLPSSKRLKMDNKNDNSHLLFPFVQHCAREGLSYLQQHSEFPVSVNSEDIVQSCSQMIKSQHNQKGPLHSYLKPQVPPEQSLGAQQYASDGPSSVNIEDMPPSSRRLTMDNENKNSHVLLPSFVQHCAPEELSYLQQQSEYPVSIISEDIVQSCAQMMRSQHNRKRPLHPYLQPQVPPEQSLGAQQYASDGTSSGNIEDMPPSSKRLKMENKNEIYHLLAPSVVQPCASEGFSYLPQQYESPVSINSEVTHVEMEPVKNSIQDSMSINGVRKCDSDIFKLNSESVPIPSGGGFVCHQMEQIDTTSGSEIIDNVKDVPRGLGSKSSHFVSDELSVDFKEDEVRTDFIQTEPKPDSYLKEVIKPQNPKTKGSLLTESFTKEQIKEHLLSLGLSIDQSILMEEREYSEDICRLCASGKLFFAPDPMYCSCCNLRIKRSVNYYCTPDGHGTRYCFCTLCYNGSRGGNISFHDICISKATLFKKKNDEETEESWVQCDKCKGWQHQICALFNGNSDLEGNAEYTCLKCLLKEAECGELQNLPKDAVFSAKDLPTTMLSDHIEQRLFRHLKQEREERAKVKGKEPSEVPGAEDLVVRVVLSVQKTLKVKQNFLDLFHDENYPAEFPYRSKVILLFQKIEGVDVCLFGMYVQEFGSECSHPNKRCVYISYLDSIKYFRPEIKTVTGEALRTFVYHEILIAYLEFCKKRGFVTSYIWACPPSKGEDYMLYCHPEMQKTPKPEKLRQWYQSMIKKAADEKIVVSLTNLYDRFFISTGERNSKVTAARLPYFDGDYWSGAAEDVIRMIEEERTADSQKKSKKTITKRTLKAMGHTNPSDGSTKDILLMQKLGQKILPMKEDFIIVDMQYVCTHCHEAILSGGRWSCSQCKNFHLCERCHDAERQINGRSMHISSNMEQHVLSQVMVDNVLSDTKHEDAVLSNDLLENRNAFLSLCEKNHYQFDTLRRAKYSSIMILHHLHNATALTAGKKCSICHKAAVVDQSWVCEICPEFGVCSTCYQEKGSSCHIHKLTQRSPTVSHRTENREALMNPLLMRQLLDVLQHACKCYTTKIQSCSNPYCLKMKKLLFHAKKCAVRATGGCPSCKKAWIIMKAHSRNCREPNCVIPRCMDLKKLAEDLRQLPN